MVMASEKITFAITGINYNLKYIKILKTALLNCNILQYYCFFLYFWSLGSIKDFFQKHINDTKRLNKVMGSIPRKCLNW